MIDIRIGDCLAHLSTMMDSSVHCVVTSPPYYGLRDYGVAGQIGLELTPEEYVARLVEVFREVRRVLRKDGTLWLNLGDSYYSPRWNGGVGANSTINSQTHQAAFRDAQRARRSRKQSKASSHGQAANRVRGLDALKPKDLIGIPWQVALALRADGWYLRQDIIWAKPNPMPESVRDRCTKSHEYLFLLSKSERYYFDVEVIAEPLAPSSIERLSRPNLDQQRGSDRVPGKSNGPMKAVAKKIPAGWHQGTRGDADPRYKKTAPVGPRFGGDKYGDDERTESRTKSGRSWVGATYRNKRDVWLIPTQPFRQAHFATFPPALVAPCILAGCPRGGTVLDPFAGAGTVGLVAQRLQRSAVLIELNPDYARMAHKRIYDDGPLLAAFAPREVDHA